ncbi:MAG: DUF362 domain-containing protein [Halanaerobiales bacterium]|nr:DUF362 domain-containing protein [Halanaerobiales bacterium]
MNLRDNRVMVLRCERYEVNRIKNLLQEGLMPWGGIEGFVKSGQKVLLKANLLMAKKPEEVTTTHPAVVHAIVEMIEEIGAKATIGDSPGGPFRRAMLQHVYRRTGMEAIAETTYAELNWNFDQIKRPFSEGKILKSITIGKYIDDADVIINLPKLKSHGMTKMSGGVKNLYGAIPGLLKAEYHLNMPNIDDFANMLIDIALCVAPQLTILDGIVGMDGEGPSAGDPVQLNTLMISPNPFALDVAIAELVGIKSDKIPLIKNAKERDLPFELKDIKLLGEPLKDLRPKKFTAPTIDYTAKLLERRLPEPVARFVTRLLRPKPVFDPEICVQCGDCIRSCPPKVIQKIEKGVEADLDKCIRCFCCQELCPKQAVNIKRPLLGKVLFRK